MKHIKPIIIFITFILFSCLILPTINNVHASESWLDGWDYRKSHLILSSENAGTNYNINITVHFSYGNDSGTDVYLSGKCLSDFKDVRFTSNDGLTLLDMWSPIQEDFNYIFYYLRILDNLSYSNVTIYIYYGNSEAESNINIFNTFPFADDFNRDDNITVGYSWIENPDIGRISSNELNITALDEGTYYTAISKSYGFTTGKYLFESKVLWTEASLYEYSYFRIYGININQLCAWGENNGYLKFLQSGVAWTSIGVSIVDSYTTLQIIVDFDNTLVSYYYNNTLAIEDTIPYSSTTTDLVGFGVAYKQYESNYYDYVFARKYVDIEPVNSIWGNEEYIYTFTQEDLEEHFVFGGIFFIIIFGSLIYVMTDKKK